LHKTSFQLLGLDMCSMLGLKVCEALENGEGLIGASCQVTQVMISPISLPSLIPLHVLKSMKRADNAKNMQIYDK
jgi:hypothetical protein